MEAITCYARGHLWLVVLVIFLLGVILIVLLPNRVVPSRPTVEESENLEHPSPEYLLDRLDNWPSYGVLRWATWRVSNRADDPVMMESLRSAASNEDGSRSALANLILFRMRDEPDRRLSLYVQSMQNSSPEDSIRLVSYLSSYLEPSDIEYLGQLEVLLSSDNPRVAEIMENVITALSQQSRE